MKEFSMLVWLTQLGLGVAMPLAGFIYLGVWLRNRFDLGAWCVVVFCVIGIISALDGLKTSLKAMEQLEKNRKKKNGRKEMGVSFNDHE